MLKLALFRNFDCRLHNTFSRRNFLLQKLSVTTPNFSDIFASKHIFSFAVIWLRLPDSKLFSGNMQFIKAFKASIAFTALLSTFLWKVRYWFFVNGFFYEDPQSPPRSRHHNQILPHAINFVQFTIILRWYLQTISWKTCFLLVFSNYCQYY